MTNQHPSITRCLLSNLRNWGITAASYSAEITKRPFEADQLTAERDARLHRYTVKDLSKIPAALCRMAGESPEAYILRIYAVSGYNSAMPVTEPKGKGKR